ncbi:MAG: DUF2752 domain-containing protein [Clostridia bacterium]|nr:DUF2752 domain-containing protein [Clostridia bacterium]
MKKIISFIKKNYIYVNITFLLLTIYIILFPMITIPIKNIFPAFGECTYLRVTGKPCPLCGGTRYIQNLPKAFTDITYLVHPFGVIMIFVLGEAIFRIYNLITKNKEKSEKYVKVDLNIHLITFTCFTIYEIVFIMIN